MLANPNKIVRTVNYNGTHTPPKPEQGNTATATLVSAGTRLTAPLSTVLDLIHRDRFGS